jgi:uncharacterized protein (DUF111 family)
VKVLIIDPVGGISGDMLLAGLIHLGCPEGYLREILGMLPVGSFELQTRRKQVNGIDALNLSFAFEETHEERTYGLIRDTILVKLPEPIRRRAEAVFEALAVAEASVHGVGIEDVHFHEVGAVDSILDIAGIAAALEFFDPDRIYCRTVTPGKLARRHRCTAPYPSPPPASIRLPRGRGPRGSLRLHLNSHDTHGGSCSLRPSRRKDPPGRPHCRICRVRMRQQGDQGLAEPVQDDPVRGCFRRG